MKKRLIFSSLLLCLIASRHMCAAQQTRDEDKKATYRFIRYKNYTGKSSLLGQDQYIIADNNVTEKQIQEFVKSENIALYPKGKGGSSNEDFKYANFGEPSFLLNREEIEASYEKVKPEILDVLRVKNERKKPDKNVSDNDLLYNIGYRTIKKSDNSKTTLTTALDAKDLPSVKDRKDPTQPTNNAPITPTPTNQQDLPPNDNPPEPLEEIDINLTNNTSGNRNGSHDTIFMIIFPASIFVVVTILLKKLQPSKGKKFSKRRSRRTI